MLIAQTCNQDIYKPGLNATIISVEPGLIATEPGLWFLATFGDLGWGKAEGRGQKAEGRKK